MIKKTITYPDLDGNSVTEDFYFHISKAELAEMELSEGGFSAKLKLMVGANDQREIIKAFKLIVSSTVGIRSGDGKRFIKNEEIRENFMQSEAYSVLFMELLTDAAACAAFISGVVPADLASQVPTGKALDDLVEAAEIAAQKKVEDYTIDELKEMPYEEFDRLVSYDVGNLPRNVLVLAMNRRAAGK